MPFIQVVFTGHKTFGGYITVDDGRTFPKIFFEPTFDTKLFMVQNGFHQIKITSMSYSETRRNNLVLDNASSVYFDDELKKKFNSTDAHIEHNFEYYDVLTIVVCSDINGNIINTPKYKVDKVTSEIYKNSEKEFENQEKLIQKANEDAKQRETAESSKNKKVKLNLALCWTCVILAVVSVIVHTPAIVCPLLLCAGYYFWNKAKKLKKK